MCADSVTGEAAVHSFRIASVSLLACACDQRWGPAEPRWAHAALPCVTVLHGHMLDGDLLACFLILLIKFIIESNKSVFTT